MKLQDTWSESEVFLCNHAGDNAAWSVSDPFPLIRQLCALPIQLVLLITWKEGNYGSPDTKGPFLLPSPADPVEAVEFLHISLTSIE